MAKIPIYCDNSKSTEDIFMKLEIWINAEYGDYAGHSLLPLWKNLVAMITNILKILQK